MDAAQLRRIFCLGVPLIILLPADDGKRQGSPHGASRRHFPTMAWLRTSPLRTLLFVLKLVQVKAKQLAILELKLQPHNLA
jgi:hypothetical protein